MKPVIKRQWKRKTAWRVISILWRAFDIITSIILFPVNIIYICLSSKLVTFFTNLLVIGSVALVFFLKTDIVNLIRNIDMKIGGFEKIACNSGDAIKKARRATVRVVGGEAEGSGFIYYINEKTNRSYILTNFHVIQSEPSPKVILYDNTFKQAEIMATDKDADLAILTVDILLPSLQLADISNLKAGDELIAVGFPFGGELGGEATIAKGALAGIRQDKLSVITYIQTDATLNQGMSGGPMMDICGQVVGINTLGTVGMGMAISADDINIKLIDLADSGDPLKDVVKIEFDPDKSPVDTVAAFYNYIKIRKLDKAYTLLTDKFLEGGSYEQWKKGYESNLDTTVIGIEIDPEKENFVNVRLSTKDLVDDEIVYKYFEGWWEVKEVDGHLKLWWPDIREVKDPDFMWFYGFGENL